jgi:hypothetical protein
MFLLGVLALTPASWADSLLPDTVFAQAQGVFGPVDVVLERAVSTREPAVSTWQQTGRPILSRYLRQQTWILPAGLRTEAAVYRVVGADPHWVFDDRTMSQLLPALDAELETPPWGCTPFGPPINRAQDLLRFTLENRRAAGLTPAAQGLSDLLSGLGTDDAGTWQPVFQRSCALDDEGFNRLDHYVFQIDPSPMSGPDLESWLVVLRTGYSE